MCPMGEGICAIVLCGGRGRRLGGIDKGLLELDGRPLAAHVCARLAAQVGGALRINCNRNQAAYQALGHPCYADAVPDGGPLAGISAGLAGTRARYCLFSPCDTPFLPLDLAERLHGALRRGESGIRYAHDGAQPHFLHCLIPTDRHGALQRWIADGGRSVHGWFAGQSAQAVDFSDAPAAFLNINSTEDLRRCQSQSRRRSA